MSRKHTQMYVLWMAKSSYLNQEKFIIISQTLLGKPSLVKIQQFWRCFKDLRATQVVMH